MLQPGFWITEDIDGHPLPRTIFEDEAKKFDSKEDALAALEKARKYRGYPKAIIYNENNLKPWE